MTDETEITERKEGVKVEVQLKRGTGTRDQDKVTVRSYYDDYAEAVQERGRLAQLAQFHAEEARSIQPHEEADKDG